MTPVFDGYGRYYDLLYRDKDYAAESAHVLSRIRATRPDASRILELGCGTAAHAVALAKQGMHVEGIDRSESMLARAAARLQHEDPEVQSRVRVACGDARSIRTGRKYDAVIALFHVVSYLNSDADLVRAFSTAAEHLTPGGIFLFDFWYGPAVLTQRPEVRVRRLSDDDCLVTRIAEPVLLSSENIVEVNYTLFIEQKATGVITSLRETHSMRYFFLPELGQLARDWFEVREVRAWLSDALPDTDTWSGCAVMVRK